MRMSNELRQRSGLAAVVGGIVGLPYWPLHSLAYFATEDGRDSEGVLRPTEWLQKPLEPLLDWSTGGASPVDCRGTNNCANRR